MNKKTQIKVRTPVGNTDTFEVNNIIMQGGIYSPISCSCQVDGIGKEFVKSGTCLYQYKECVNITALSMIDDLLTVAKCGIDSVVMNAVINTKIMLNKLILSQPKCHKMHVGANEQDCPCLFVRDDIYIFSSKSK